MLEDIDEVLETMKFEEKPSINGEIQPIETFVGSKSATVFESFEALHNIVLNIDDQLVYSDVLTKVGKMYEKNATIV
jgi:uncharacterized protein YqgV (UPF0045/DUF77 family)